jgi:L-aminopeptidase/D-esterase-like protein
VRNDSASPCRRLRFLVQSEAGLLPGADFTALGLALGHATDEEGATGCTVIRGIDGPFRAAAAIFGRATGTRELHVLSPEHIVDRVDAILLTGGSAYGLDAASGVMRWMEERGRGFDVGVGVVPIVPAAVVFDLVPLGRPDARPTPDMGYSACEMAVASGFDEGSVGAGTGTIVGKATGMGTSMKGGLGCAIRTGGTVTVGAVAVVNSLGDVRDASGRVIAGALDPDRRFIDTMTALTEGGGPDAFRRARTLRNTTLAVVATDVVMDKVVLAQLAHAAGAALFKRITPTGTTFDGDVVFAICPVGTSSVRPAVVLQTETLAVAALETAIERAVRLARGRDGVPGLGDPVSE